MYARFPAVLVDSILLALVILPATWAVAAIGLDPVLPFGLLTWVALAALLVGLGFALSGLPGEILHPIGLAGGVVGVFYLVARVLPDVPPDTSLGERLGHVAGEIIAWFTIVLGGGQATNNLLFLLLLALISWVIGYFGAWSVFRMGSAWWPVTASFVAQALVLATFPNLYGYMVPQLIASMVLIARTNLEARRRWWEAVGLREVSGLAGRVFRVSLAAALGLVVLAWLAPTVLAARALSESLGHAAQPWEAAQEEFNRFFGGLQARNEGARSGFSRAMTLHGSFHLSDTPVLQISAPRPEYWRAVVYDQYTGHGWLSSDPIDQRILPPGLDILRPQDLARSEMVQQVTVLAPRGNYLVGADQPVQFDRPVRAQAYADAPGTSVDLVAALSIEPLRNGSRYSVVSDVSVASVDELRAAGQSYPPEVRQRYLPLPPIPERVHQLALQITSSAQTPYDKAEALEAFLRSMPYTLDLPPPPSDRDAVDYFLFTARTGYCDYFASAMAVMARSIGLPARVVSGYATGERQEDGSYLVRDANSHSWTEVYFPPYGWIPFEPSGSWPRFERGPGAAAAATPTPIPTLQVPPGAGQSQSQSTPTPTPTPTAAGGEAVPPSSPSTLQPPDLHPYLPLLYLVAFLALVIAILWYLWVRGLRGLPPSAVAYAKMLRLAGWLGFGIYPHETPDEYGEALARALPDVRASVRRITAAYARYRFGPPVEERGEGVLRLWRFVRNALLRRIGRLHRSRY